MILPSKKLLSEVINLNVLYITDDQNGILTYGFDESCGNMISRDSKINMYELMHLMKEWAYSKGYSLSSCRDFIVEGYSCGITNEDAGFIKTIISNTEFEVIAKACEFILKEQKGEN